MGRSQVLFNRKKGRGRGGGSGGRSDHRPGRGYETHDNRSGKGEQVDSMNQFKAHAPQQNIDDDRSLSYSEPMEDTSADHTATDQTLNSLLDLGTGTGPSAASVGTRASGSVLTCSGLLVAGDSDILVPDDISRVSEVSFTSLNLSALHATLLNLSLQERFKIPQHLIDTLGIDEAPAVVTPPPSIKPSSSSPLPPMLPRSATLTHPLRLASAASGTSTAYDGDDDSDAILRSRRSEGDEGSSLPTNEVGSKISTRGEESIAEPVEPRNSSPPPPPVSPPPASPPPPPPPPPASPPAAAAAILSTSVDEEEVDDVAETAPTEQVVQLLDELPPLPDTSIPVVCEAHSRLSNEDVAEELQPFIGENWYMQNSVASNSSGGGGGGPGSTTALASRTTTAMASRTTTAMASRETTAMTSRETIAAISRATTTTAVVSRASTLIASRTTSSSAKSKSTNPPSNSTQAVAGSSFASSNPQRNLIQTDTTEAVAGSASSLAYSGVSGGGIRYNDSMLPVVSGKPVSSAERSVLLPNLIVSASAQVSTGSATIIGPSPHHPGFSTMPRYMSPTSSNSQRSLDPTLSPGRNPTCPIDLSDVESTTGSSVLQRQSSAPPFSVPEGRIKAIYVDASSNLRQQTSPTHPARRRQSPAKRTVFSGSGATDGAVVKQRATVDAIEKARSLEAYQLELLNEGGPRRRVGFEVATQDGSSTEPDSAAAVIAPNSTRSLGRGIESNRASTPQQQRKLALEGLSVSGSSSTRTYVRSPISSTTVRDASITPVAAFESRRGGTLARGHHQPPQIFLQSTTPRHPGTAPRPPSSSAKPQPAVFFADVGGNEKRGDHYDDWLDSALASKTFDKDYGDQEDPEKEALSDWLDSVIT